jgi:hypothetical protein
MGVNDENILREKAREAIASGKLSMRKAHRALGGLGTGRTCALCCGLLTPTQMEIEIHLIATRDSKSCICCTAS